MTPDIELLLDAAEDGDLDATRELFMILRGILLDPEKRVATAFRLKRRGGQPRTRAQLFEERDVSMAEFTELQLGGSGTRSNRIRVARTKLSRYAANGWPHERDKPDDTGNRERDLMRKIMRSGLPMPGERQHREIVRKRTKK